MVLFFWFKPRREHMAFFKTIVSIISKPYQLWIGFKQKLQCDREVVEHIIVLDDAIDQFISLITKRSTSTITVLGDKNPDWEERIFKTRKKINNLTNVLEKKRPQCTRRTQKKISDILLDYKITLKMYQNY